MSSLALDTAPVGKYAQLITLSWGASPTVARYTTYDYDLTIGGTLFTSEILMEAETSSAQSGGVSDVPWYVRLPATRQPANLVARIYPHADIYCRIEECDPTDTTGTQRRIQFYGVISKSTKNKGGFKRLVQMEVAGIKQLLQYSSGIVSDQQCPWALGDGNCCVDLAPLTQNVKILNVQKTIATVQSVSSPAGDSTYWNLGSMTYDGLSIMVRSFAGFAFKMEQLIPPEWLGQTVQLKPGCSKFAEVCNSRFGNLEHFNGTGIVIPAYHPQFETSAG